MFQWEFLHYLRVCSHSKRPDERRTEDWTDGEIVEQSVSRHYSLCGVVAGRCKREQWWSALLAKLIKYAQFQKRNLHIPLILQSEEVEENWRKSMATTTAAGRVLDGWMDVVVMNKSGELLWRNIYYKSVNSIKISSSTLASFGHNNNESGVAYATQRVKKGVGYCLL